ncbi:MAG: hypothetical protein WB616_22860 [Candidatus Sulfotelmatobacter sp.]
MSATSRTRSGVMVGQTPFAADLSALAPHSGRDARDGIGGGMPLEFWGNLKVAHYHHL